jgi:hypothetical protein
MLSVHRMQSRSMNLKRVRSQIIRDTGFAPDIVVFSDATADLFTNNEQVLDQLNKLHFIAGRVEPMMYALPKVLSLN